MSRDEIVRISRLVAFGGLTDIDVNSILMSYCKDHDKPYDKIVLFVRLLFESGQYMPFFLEALEHYEKKFTICKLQSRPNLIGQRQVIYIN